MKDHATMGLGYKVKAKGIKYSKYKGHLRAKLVAQTKDNSGERVYYYSCIAMSDNAWYELVGVRSTKKAAQKALDTFEIL